MSIIIIFVGGLLIITLVVIVGKTGSTGITPETESKADCSFYVDEDGTIVRSKNNESKEKVSGSIINDENEQKEALSLIQESADAGIAEAQYYLGLCYEQGSVVEKDLDLAKKWYRLAASQSYPLAKFRLGKLMMDNKQ